IDGALTLVAYANRTAAPVSRRSVLSLRELPWSLFSPKVMREASESGQDGDHEQRSEQHDRLSRMRHAKDCVIISARHHPEDARGYKTTQEKLLLLQAADFLDSLAALRDHERRCAGAVVSCGISEAAPRDATEHDDVVEHRRG